MYDVCTLFPIGASGEKERESHWGAACSSAPQFYFIFCFGEEL